MTPAHWIVAVVIAALLAGGSGAAAHHFAGGGTRVSARAQAAISWARHQIGKPYIFGATGPAAFDCSGLVMTAYAHAGVSLPRTSEDQWAEVRHVAPGHEEPGDLVFFWGDGEQSPPAHVALVIRPGWMIEAYATGWPVRVTHYGTPSSPEGDQAVYGYARPVPLVRGYTPRQWARAFLRDAGFPPTACNMAAVTAWMGTEGGHWQNGARFNPLNTTYDGPGQSWLRNGKVTRTVNSVGVRAYNSWDTGLRASVATIGLGHYTGLRAALRNGHDAQSVADAIAASPWGTRPFEARC